MAKVITFGSIKGGVAKTTSIAALGEIYSSRGYKTLVIDSDPQGNLTKTFTPGDFERTIYDAFLGSATLADITHRVSDTLYLVPSNRGCSNIENLVLIKGKQLTINVTLKNLLAPEREKYDIILIDSPGYEGYILTNDLIAADYLLIPIYGDGFSVDGFNGIHDLYKQIVNSDFNPRLRLLGSFFIKYHKTYISVKEVECFMKQNYPQLLFSTGIRECKKVDQAPLSQCAIFNYAPKCTASVDYCTLADEILERISVFEK